jgi:hypothetical protein
VQLEAVARLCAYLMRHSEHLPGKRGRPPRVVESLPGQADDHLPRLAHGGWRNAFFACCKPRSTRRALRLPRRQKWTPPPWRGVGGSRRRTVKRVRCEA